MRRFIYDEDFAKPYATANTDSGLFSTLCLLQYTMMTVAITITLMVTKTDWNPLLWLPKLSVDYHCDTLVYLSKIAEKPIYYKLYLNSKP